MSENTELRNDDWLKTCTWDLWVTDNDGKHTPVRNVDELFHVRGVPDAKRAERQAALSRLLRLPSSEAMPRELVDELTALGYSFA